MTILFVLFLALLVVIIAAAATVALALGSLLSHIFAVSAFEATIVVVVFAAVAIYWIATGPPAPSTSAGTDPDEDDPDEIPTIIYSSLPRPPRPSARRRKR